MPTDALPREPAPAPAHGRADLNAEPGGPVAADPVNRRRMRLKLLGILAVCAAPVVASYLAYYVVKPDGRSNYGELIEPQRPAASLPVVSPAGAAGGMERFRGKWVLLTTAEQACDAACAQRLYVMRQVRLTTGRDRDRIERVLLITDGSTPSAALLAEHEGLQLLRADPSALAAVLPPPEAAAGPPTYVIDPLGNLMMRFPAQADPNRMKKDIAKLLRASRIG